MCVICIHVFVITAVNIDGAHGVSRQPDENSTGNKHPETEMPDTGEDGIMQPLKQPVDQTSKQHGMPTDSKKRKTFQETIFNSLRCYPPSHDKFF